MFSDTDERRGLVKTNWACVRKRVHRVAPTFAELIDSVNPSDQLPLFIGYYPYGERNVDVSGPLLPDMNGGTYRLCTDEAPKTVFKHLGYGYQGTPFSLMLDNSFEISTEPNKQHLSVPIRLLQAGDFFPLGIFFQNNHRRYDTYRVVNCTAGGRSVFLLPNIGSTTQHIQLQHKYDFHQPSIKSAKDHWLLFKKLLSSKQVDCDWRACVLYFSESFYHNILYNPEWCSIKEYVFEQGWRQSEYDRNHYFFDIICSKIQKYRNLRPNTPLFQVSKMLLKIALGITPGFEPLTDNHLLPLPLLQTIFVEDYGLKHYSPTIMGPKQFIFETANDPVYFSLKLTNPHASLALSRKSYNTLHELRELSHLIATISDEISKDNGFCDFTSFQKVFKNINVDYFHNREDSHRIARLSNHIAQYDKRFITPSHGDVAHDSPFFRGCVSIKPKKAHAQNTQ